MPPPGSHRSRRIGGSRRPAPEVTIGRPRLSIPHVLRRVVVRLLEIQVWDVAGTMTFYTLLSIVPAAIALVSLVSIVGVEQQTVDTLTGLLTEIFPSLDPEPYVQALLAAAGSRGGLLGFLAGTLGAILSASNGVAAFHRALHRVYDTREGRPFLRFRLLVVGETLVLILVVTTVAFLLVVGGEATQRIGELMGIPRVAFQIFNVLKWPALLALLAVCVSLAYHLFPNVRLPRYRVLTLGSVLSVGVLFAAALLVGRLAVYATRFTEVLSVLNGLTGILVLLWLADIVIIAGAVLDAEFLRARRIALGLPAWDHFALEPVSTSSLDFFEQDAEADAELLRSVAEAARTGRPLRRPRTLDVVEADSPLAVNPTRATHDPRDTRDTRDH